MKAAEFDKRFDDGEEDVMAFLDLENVERPHLEKQKIMLELPVWMVELLDKEAVRLGESRQALIKFWLADRLAAH